MSERSRRRTQLKPGAVRELIEKTPSLALEHDRMTDQGCGLPRVTLIRARSGLATIRATWWKSLKNGSVSHRVILRGVATA
ncbi:MAG: hypothetical protein KG075_07470 [Alphaproteobacteria bacterium]|nr:hypothetical protein [Alphaproteobacteria bacterium]